MTCKVMQRPRTSDTTVGRNPFMTSRKLSVILLSLRRRARPGIAASTLLRAKPESNPIQVSSEAMEMALKEFADRLASVSQPNENQALSLDEIMEHMGRHTPRV
jgi:hypothetical protein